MIPIIFRYDDNERQAVAVFPTLSANNVGNEMITYDEQLTKQGRTLDWFKGTRIATRPEYIQLKKRIERNVGNDVGLSIHRNLKQGMHIERIKHAKLAKPCSEKK